MTYLVIQKNVRKGHDTAEEAIEQAKKNVAMDQRKCGSDRLGGRRKSADASAYLIVQVIKVVEPAQPPIETRDPTSGDFQSRGSVGDDDEDA